MLDTIIKDTWEKGFDEEFPNFDKGRHPGTLPAWTLPDPSNGVQPSSFKSTLRSTLHKGKKHPRPDNTGGVEEEEDEEEAGNKEVAVNVTITREALVCFL